jgi:hypothetical protein
VAKNARHSVKNFMWFCLLVVRNPPIKWAQRRDKLYLKITLRDIKDEKVDILANKFEFSCTSDEKKYAFSCDFFAEVVPEETVKRNLGLQYELQIFKLEKSEPYWPRITKEKIKLTNV